MRWRYGRSRPANNPGGSHNRDPDGEIVSYTCTMDQNTTLTGETTQTTLNPGTHTITHTVTDNNGATGTAVESVEIPRFFMLMRIRRCDPCLYGRPVRCVCVSYPCLVRTS